MVSIINGTPHEITIYNAGDTFASEDGRRFFLKEGAAPAMVIPKIFG